MPVHAACVFNVAGTSASAVSDGITLNAPASPANNDIWIAVISSIGNGITHSITDWTEIYQDDTTATSAHIGVWYHRYAGSTPNLVVARTGGTNIVGQIAQLRGCDRTGSPVDTLGTATEHINSDTATFATVTPSTSNTLLLAVWNYNDDLGVTTGPNGFTEGFFADGGGSPGAYLYYKSHVSGATGGFTASMSAQGTNDDGEAMLIAIGQAPVRRGGPIIFQ